MTQSAPQRSLGVGACQRVHANSALIRVSPLSKTRKTDSCTRGTVTKDGTAGRADLPARSANVNGPGHPAQRGPDRRRGVGRHTTP